jgi:glycopeptide antibiotics resistance protein
MRVLVLRLVFAAYLVVMGFVVWSPQPAYEAYPGILGAIARWIAASGLPLGSVYDTLEVGANVVMFVPFGVLAMTAYRWTRVWSTTLAGLATSALIEGVQLFLPTRFATVSDLVANTAGAFLGALAVAIVRRNRAPR